MDSRARMTTTRPVTRADAPAALGANTLGSPALRHPVAVNRAVTVEADGHPVVNLVANRREFLPLFYVVGVQTFNRSALLACVLVAGEYSSTPLFIPITGALLACSLILVFAQREVTALLPAVFRFVAAPLFEWSFALQACENWRGVESRRADGRTSHTADRNERRPANLTRRCAAWKASLLTIACLLKAFSALRANLHRQSIAQINTLERMTNLGLKPELQ